MSSSRRPGPRRTVAARILLSYAVMLFAFCVAAGWSLWAQRSSAREAELLRDGYLPLALSLRDAVASQDTWNTQLNHVTTARNPVDKRIWFETALSIGRPKRLGEVRSRIEQVFTAGDEQTAAIGADLLTETTHIEVFLRKDEPLVAQLFEALALPSSEQSSSRAEALRDELVTRGSTAKKKLSSLERLVQTHVDALLDEARSRERLALGILVALGGLTLLLGLLMVLYARRVLRPLALVTERAKAVGEGDLTPRQPLGSRDELGELSATFERMVAAISEANERLLATERLATIGKMAAHVTHEVRNPLSSIALNLELLEEEIGGDEAESRALVRAISREVERLSALSGQYLSMAKNQPPRLEPELLAEVVEDAAEFMRPELRRHGISLVVEADPQTPLVPVDEAQLKQALFNLIRNAREAMSEGGTIRVSVAPRGGGAVLTVEDEGPGIELEAAERLFDPFFTTKRHGTGLGLAVTRQIVAAHGGKIRYELRPEGGSRFVLELPAGTDPVTSDPAPEAQPNAAEAGAGMTP
jgi:signal transduction histidine kinase